MDQATIRELQTVPLFSTLSADRMGCLEPGEIIQLPAGKIIANEGDPIDSFFVVLEGEMRISRNYGNSAILARWKLSRETSRSFATTIKSCRHRRMCRLESAKGIESTR